ncbi:hypothetical protein F5X98DRAFT_254231 [Xylaria grammica]|nr:hypothetical protein F5X98DRAFT_254231 [Xylaria grammica]
MFRIQLSGICFSSPVTSSGKEQGNEGREGNQVVCFKLGHFFGATADLSDFLHEHCFERIVFEYHQTTQFLQPSKSVYRPPRPRPGIRYALASKAQSDRFVGVSPSLGRCQRSADGADHPGRIQTSLFGSARVTQADLRGLNPQVNNIRCQEIHRSSLDERLIFSDYA